MVDTTYMLLRLTLQFIVAPIVLVFLKRNLTTEHHINLRCCINYHIISTVYCDLFVAAAFEDVIWANNFTFSSLSMLIIYFILFICVANASFYIIMKIKFDQCIINYFTIKLNGNPPNIYKLNFQFSNIYECGICMVFTTISRIFSGV